MQYDVNAHVRKEIVENMSLTTFAASIFVQRVCDVDPIVRASFYGKIRQDIANASNFDNDQLVYLIKTGLSDR
jgi:hypothetical protein